MSNNEKAISEMKAQIKELEERIKALKNQGNAQYGIAKLESRYYSDTRMTEWLVRLSTVNTRNFTWNRWHTIITSPKREDAIEKIDQFITSLQGLKERALAYDKKIEDAERNVQGGESGKKNQQSNI